MPGSGQGRIGTRPRARLASRSIVAALAPLACAPMLAEAQPYVAGRVGYANSDLALGEPYNGVVDDGSIAYGVAVGADLGRFLGFELTATGYGSFEGRASPCPIGEVCPAVTRTTNDNDVTTYTATVTPQIMLARVDFFGRVGYYRANINADAGFGNSDFSENGLLIGAGARWDFEDKPWNISIEAARFDDNLYQFTLGFGWQLELGAE